MFYIWGDKSSPFLSSNSKTFSLPSAIASSIIGGGSLKSQNVKVASGPRLSGPCLSGLCLGGP
jgi:hypothetical protein